MDEIEKLWRLAVRALEAFEAANKKKPAMEPARLYMLNALAQTARQRAAEAVNMLSQNDLEALIEKFDTTRRVEAMKAGLIGTKPSAMVVQ
jgi:hypothetical protein